MIEPTLTEIVYGTAWGHIYDFEEGAELPTHIHNEFTTHMSFIMLGTFLITRSGVEHTHSFGEYVSFEPGEEHSIKALTKGRIFQLRKANLMA